MVTTIVLVVLIVGLLMFALSTNGKIAEIGRIMFGCALLALLFGADRAITLLR